MFTDPRLQALSYAILAPNPHNRQPWLVELRGEHELVLYCDLDRTLPETDPEGRQIVIGLGCFLELLRLAASEQGQIAEIDTFPEGSAPDRLTATPIARVIFRRDQGVRPDPLMKQVLKRRSIRSAKAGHIFGSPRPEQSSGGRFRCRVDERSGTGCHTSQSYLAGHGDGITDPPGESRKRPTYAYR